MPILKTYHNRHLEDPEEFCSSEFQTGLMIPFELLEQEVVPVIPEKGKSIFWNLLLKMWKRER